MTLAGTVTVCADSHTPTNGAFGVLAFGVGIGEQEYVWQLKLSLSARRIIYGSLLRVLLMRGLPRRILLWLLLAILVPRLE